MEYIVLQNLDGSGPRPRTRSLHATPVAFGDDQARAKPQVQLANFEKNSEVADALRDPRTVSVARNMPIKLIEPFDGLSADVSGGDPWGIGAVRADGSAFTGKGVKVAVLDTGLMAGWQSHAAFTGKSITQRNFTNEPAHDEHGHGTHCAGTIFGSDVGNRRIGIARDAIPIIGKVLGRRGGTTAALLQSIQWAAQEGADIISMSLGYDFPGMVAEGVEQELPPNLAASIALEAYRANLRAMDALLQMLEQSIEINERSRPLVIAAAGNESSVVGTTTVRIAPALPSAAHGVLSVGALRQRSLVFLEIAEFSNGIPWISAPGVDILSVNSKTGGLKSMSGTSMACPHVAGVAALWWERAAQRHQGSSGARGYCEGSYARQRGPGCARGAGRGRRWPGAGTVSGVTASCISE